jgi:hypothetical protein
MDDLRHEPVIELDTPNITPEAEPTGQNKKSGDGLAESQHAPLASPPGHCTPPPGPKAWREMIAMRKKRLKKSKAGRQQILPQQSKLEQSEAEISELKEKISQKEKARVNNSNNNNDIRADEEGWTRVNKYKTAKPKPNSLKIKGKFKLVIGSSDDGTRLDTGTVQQEIRSACQNRTLTSQLGTD